MQSSLSKEIWEQRGKRVDKDQVKGIIKELHSRGLSLRRISDILRETYSVDISYVTVGEILKDTPERPTEETHVKDEETVVEVKPPEQVPVATENVVVEALHIIEPKQERINKVAPRDLDEEYKKYWQEARRRENLRRERDMDIIAFVFVPLALGGLILLLLWFNHWVI